MSMEFTAEYIARLVGKTSYELLQMHPEDFGSPGHYRMMGRGVVYTVKGVAALAEEFSSAGESVNALLLRTLAEQNSNRAGMSYVPRAALVKAYEDGGVVVSSVPHNWALDWERRHE